jgi:hypothetical protein
MIPPLRIVREPLLVLEVFSLIGGDVWIYMRFCAVVLDYPVLCVLRGPLMMSSFSALRIGYARSEGGSCVDMHNRPLVLGERKTDYARTFLA